MRRAWLARAHYRRILSLPRQRVCGCDAEELGPLFGRIGGVRRACGHEMRRPRSLEAPRDFDGMGAYLEMRNCAARRITNRLSANE